MIDPNNIERISQLIQDEIAFPLIKYIPNQPLNLNKTTLHGAYTTISNRVDHVYLEGLIWNANGDIGWQNEMLQFLSVRIFEMISQYQNDPTDYLLTKIFIWIQLWGGNSGRSVFVRGNGWPNNFNINVYRTAVQHVLNNDFQIALNEMNTLYGISTAFSTKHIHFWSNAVVPIYDSIIAAIVFGRKSRQVRPNEYQLYINGLDELITELNNEHVTRSSIERNLFNWANTPSGMQWRRIRLGQ